jgi:predicted nucleotidyltransferase component of viral defense system
MCWYEENKEEWKAVIAAVSAELGRSPVMVEKDTIQSMFLLGLSRSSLPFVFKGGTSLSKVYGLIDRFSEDIDLSMERKLTASEKRASSKLILDIAGSLGLTLSNPDDIRSRHDFNQYRFTYPSLFTEAPTELVVETSYYQTTYPSHKQKVDSFVGKFCKENNIELPIPFEAADTVMTVQTVDRALVDKVFAVCDYYLANMAERDSRHLYDICRLLPHVALDDRLDELIDTVRQDRMFSKNNPSAQPEYNIPDMLREIIRTRFYEQDYKNITQSLLYDDVSYEQAIRDGIAVVAESDVFLYKKDTGKNGPSGPGTPPAGTTACIKDVLQETEQDQPEID